MIPHVLPRLSLPLPRRGPQEGGPKAKGEPKAAAPARPPILRSENGVWEALKGHQLFGENATLRTDAAYLLQAGPLALARMRTDNSLLLNGRLGWMNGARFVSAAHRTDYDFRYAFGEGIYRGAMAAAAYLAAIPKGQLSKALREFDDKGEAVLLNQVSKLSYVPGEGPVWEELGHKLRDWTGQKVIGGEYRTWQSRTVEFRDTNPDDIRELDANGDTWIPDRDPLRRGYGHVQYPMPDAMKKAIHDLFLEVADALERPDADVIALAARTGQQIIIQHPERDGVGHLGRLVMERILAEADLPPPILAQLDEDESLSPEEYKQHVMEGISRTIKLLDPAHYNGAPDPLTGSHWTRDYGPCDFTATQLAATSNGTFGAFPPDARRLTLQGLSYSLGPDGFVYNEMGRPHRVNDAGQLVAMPLVNYYYVIRALGRAKDPCAALTAFTQPTRDWFGKTVSDPDSASKLNPPEDRWTFEPDNVYRPAFTGSADRSLLELLDPARSTPVQLFARQYSYGTAATYTMARYAQLDLEYWQLEQALKESSDFMGAAQLRGYRRELFTEAKAFLSNAAPDPKYKSSSNPLGLHYAYEQIQYEHSPLRYASFDEAVRRMGDSHLYVWRGTTGVDRFMGLQPEHDVRRPDAFGLAKLRAKEGGTGNVLRSINHDNGTTDGMGVLCATSDIGLEVGSTYGKGELYQGVDLTALPPELGRAVDRLLPEKQSIRVGSLRASLNRSPDRSKLPPMTLDIRGATPGLLKEIFTDITPYDPTSTPQAIRDALLAACEKALATADHETPGQRLAAYLSGDPVPVDFSKTPYAKYCVPEWQRLLDDTRDLVRLTRNGARLEVELVNRVLMVRLPKTDGLPGLYTQRGMFQSQQEVTLLKRELPWPWRIVHSYSTDELMQERFSPVPPPGQPGAAAADPSAKAP